MDVLEFGKYKNAFLVLALLIAVLEIPGGLDLRNAPHAGYWTDGNNTVTRVFPDSPAERAGFMVGDYITSSGGISMKDSEALARRSRAKVGETWSFDVQREGEPMSLALTFSGLPTKQLIISLAAAVIGFCFLLFGTMAYLRVPSKNSILLALVGLCLGFAFINQMYFDSYTLRTIYALLGLAIVVFGIAALFHFMMAFPKAKAMLSRKHMLKIIYAPAALLTLFVFYLMIFQPDATSGLNIFVNVMFGILLVGYFGLAAVAMIHSYVRATKQERSNSGLNYMLLGTIVGLGPIIINSLVGTVAPKVVLPGAEFYFLTMVFIPISLAMATIKKGTATPAAAPT
jgi:hypothetical protein